VILGAQTSIEIDVLLCISCLAQCPTFLHRGYHTLVAGARKLQKLFASHVQGSRVRPPTFDCFYYDLTSNYSQTVFFFLNGAEELRVISCCISTSFYIYMRLGEVALYMGGCFVQGSSPILSIGQRHTALLREKN